MENLSPVLIIKSELRNGALSLLRILHSNVLPGSDNVATTFPLDIFNPPDDFMSVDLFSP